MAPGTNTGASHPVAMNGEPLEPVMKQKIENDAAAFMRGIASGRARNVDAAERTVRESASYTDREALEKNLIDLIAPDEASLRRQLQSRQIRRFDGRIQTLPPGPFATEPYRVTLRQKVLSAIADPNIALFLLVLGALGIYAEFSQPGLIAPGVAGAMLVLLGLTAMALFPIDWLGAALMLLGLTFLALEAKFATHGVLTAGGAIALFAGSLLLIDTNIPALRISWITALAVTVPFALITSFLVSIAVRARRNKTATGREAMLGETAVAVGALDPAGTVMVRGEYWKAESTTPISPSEKVTIVVMHGLTLKVEPLPGERI
jgi:membrane-bound serine protease (ClpP class)